MWVVCLFYLFIFQTNDEHNKHLVEFDISCGITEAKNMKTDFFFKHNRLKIL